MSELSDVDARWKPAPDRFSIAEVLAHLSHSEGHCYRARLDKFLAEEMPEFEPDDAQMHLHLYGNGDPEEDFGHFEERARDEPRIAARPHGGCRLAQSEPSRGRRDHPLRDAARVGTPRLGHVRQIAELVRARKYLAGAGPLGDDYQLNP